MKKLKTTVRKSAELQGPTKTKKITVTDFKKETNKKPEVLNNNKEVLNNNNLVPYKGFGLESAQSSRSRRHRVDWRRIH